MQGRLAKLSDDDKGRVVGVSEVRYRNGENVGHFAEYVDSYGYWRRGFYDAEAGFGGQTCHEFIEEEVIDTLMVSKP